MVHHLDIVIADNRDILWYLKPHGDAFQIGAHSQIGIAANDRCGSWLGSHDLTEQMAPLGNTPLADRKMLGPDRDPLFGQRILNTLQARFGPIIVLNRLGNNGKNDMSHFNEITCHIKKKFAVVRPDTGSVGLRRINKGIDDGDAAAR